MFIFIQYVPKEKELVSIMATMNTLLQRIVLALAVVSVCIPVKAEWVYNFKANYSFDQWHVTEVLGQASWSFDATSKTATLTVSPGGSAYVWTDVAGIDLFATRNNVPGGIPDPANYMYFSYNRDDGDIFGYYRWNDNNPPTAGDYNYVSGPYEPYSGDVKIGSLVAGEKIGFLLSNPDNHDGLVSSLNIKNFKAPVPEPETYAMASGLALVGFIAYRRFRRVPPTV
jgi:hypothetical protein